MSLKIKNLSLFGGLLIGNIFFIFVTNLYLNDFIRISNQRTNNIQNYVLHNIEDSMNFDEKMNILKLNANNRNNTIADMNFYFNITMALRHPQITNEQKEQIKEIFSEHKDGYILEKNALEELNNIYKYLSPVNFYAYHQLQKDIQAHENMILKRKNEIKNNL